MARPKTKSELLDLGQANFDKLLGFVEKLATEKQSKDFPEGTLNRNIADVYMHVCEWHKMTMAWHEVGIVGQKPDMPAKGYTWKTLPDLNKRIWEKYQAISLEEALVHLKKSHQDIRSIIESYSTGELFEKKKYKWTGSTSMAAYFISSTASHYDWAFKLIKKAKK